MASLQHHPVVSAASLAELVVLDDCFQDPVPLPTVMLVALGSGFDVLAALPPIQVILNLLCPSLLILTSYAKLT